MIFTGGDSLDKYFPEIRANSNFGNGMNIEYLTERETLLQFAVEQCKLKIFKLFVFIRCENLFKSCDFH